MWKKQTAAVDWIKTVKSAMDIAIPNSSNKFI